MAGNRKKAAGVGMVPNRKSSAEEARTIKGVKVLRKAAGQQLEQHGDELAESLRKAAVAGDMKCAQLLISLAEFPADADEPDRNPPLWSMARQLAGESPWRGEQSEDGAEASANSLEPEG